MSRSEAAASYTGCYAPAAIDESVDPLAQVEESLRTTPSRWLVAGAAGFIGSHLLARLLELDQTVVGLDNFASGSRRNLDEVLDAAESSTRRRFSFIQGDIRDPDACRRACAETDFVLHHAALASVAGSIEDPQTTNAVNVDGHLNMLIAARDAGVRRFVYASSAAVYGDDPRLPRSEGQEGRPMSPYGVTKAVDELYASSFQHVFGMPTIGLRYFNVFGARQDPDGPYAAVIPRWIGALLRGEQCVVFGDGNTSRDFCHVADVANANLLAAAAPDAATGRAYNVASGRQTTLNELYVLLRDRVAQLRPGLEMAGVRHEAARPGDIRHSGASLELVSEVLGYTPRFELAAGLDQAMAWYVEHLG